VQSKVTDRGHGPDNDDQEGRCPFLCAGPFHFAVLGTSRQGLQGTKSSVDPADVFEKHAGDALLRRVGQPQHVVHAESNRFLINLDGPTTVLIKHTTGFSPKADKPRTSREVLVLLALRWSVLRIEALPDRSDTPSFPPDFAKRREAARECFSLKVQEGYVRMCSPRKVILPDRYRRSLQRF
jgi:hypothetical protein